MKRLTKTRCYPLRSIFLSVAQQTSDMTQLNSCWSAHSI